MAVDASGLRVLSEDRCMELLSVHLPHVGRIGLAGVPGPVVLPVNYRVADGTIVFRTGPGSLLAGLDGDQVAFEVDEVDEAWESGWSVLVRGPARRVTDEGELARLRRLPLRSWAGEGRSVYIRIEPVAVTGRRIG